MPKFNKKRVQHICALIKKDSYTVAELCSLSGISERTYYNWMRNNLQFLQSIKGAREEFDQMLVVVAKRSMVKKIKGYTVQEKKVVYADSHKPGVNGQPVPKIKEYVVIDKFIPPDTGMIIFVLCNTEPKIWKNYRRTELTGKDGKDLFYKLSDEELDVKLAELDKKLRK